MKKSIILIAIVSSLFALQTAKAQNPITTLEHAGVTTVYYGQNSLVDAYNASVNGDKLYLSAGFFNSPQNFAKGVSVMGAGHFPDSANVAKRTTLMSTFWINKGADSLRLEGLYINGTVNPDWSVGTSQINYVRIIRCRMNGVAFYSKDASASKNNWTFEECFIFNGIDFSKFGSNLLISKCILGVTGTGEYCGSSSVLNINGAALIDGNIFLPSGECPKFIYNVYSSVIQNNIILTNYGFSNSNSNYFKNNICTFNPDFGSNSYSNNYLGVAQANIFVNQTGNTIDYTHNYHLKEPLKYIGTDGTQVGLYGGFPSFKEKGLPSNPQILKKEVAAQTDNNGNLKINFVVKAQDR